MTPLQQAVAGIIGVKAEEKGKDLVTQEKPKKMIVVRDPDVDGCFAVAEEDAYNSANESGRSLRLDECFAVGLTLENAYLVAAARDLFDACKRALAEAEDGLTMGCVEDLQAAIKQAEGRHG